MGHGPDEPLSPVFVSEERGEVAEDDETAAASGEQGVERAAAADRVQLVQFRVRARRRHDRQALLFAGCFLQQQHAVGQRRLSRRVDAVQVFLGQETLPS